MNDSYYYIFYNMVKENNEFTGADLPEDIEVYIIMLLAYYTDRPLDVLETNFGLSFLQISKNKYKFTKELGDKSLFVSGVFPDLGVKYGIKKSYYQDIGISCYETISEKNKNNLFTRLSKYFYFLSDFINHTVTNSKKYINHGI